MCERAGSGLPVRQNGGVLWPILTGTFERTNEWRRFPRQGDLIQASLLEHDVFSDNEAVGGHFFQLRQNAADVFVGVDEGDDYRQFASSLD